MMEAMSLREAVGGLADRPLASVTLQRAAGGAHQYDASGARLLTSREVQGSSY